MSSFLYTLFLISVITPMYYSQAAEKTFWEDDLTNQNGMDESGDVSIGIYVIGTSPCPAVGIFTSCTKIDAGGRTWTKLAYDTSQYHHIKLGFWVNIDLIGDGEYCKVHYSIDDSFNWIEIGRSDETFPFFVDIELPLNASDNSGGVRIMFEMDATGLGTCYLNSALLEGTLITADPTKAPTIQPTIEPTANPTYLPTYIPTKPTSFPTNDPTSEPTMIPSSNPTIEPTFDPTVQPTTPTNIPSISPTKGPTTHNPTLYFPPTSPPIAPTEIITTLSETDSTDIGPKSFLEDNTYLIIGIMCGGFICCFVILFLIRQKQKKKIMEETNDGITIGMELGRVVSATATDTGGFVTATDDGNVTVTAGAYTQKQPPSQPLPAPPAQIMQQHQIVISPPSLKPLHIVNNVDDDDIDGDGDELYVQKNIQPSTPSTKDALLKQQLSPQLRSGEQSNEDIEQMYNNNGNSIDDTYTYVSKSPQGSGVNAISNNQNNYDNNDDMEQMYINNNKSPQGVHLISNNQNNYDNNDDMEQMYINSRSSQGTDQYDDNTNYGQQKY